MQNYKEYFKSLANTKSLTAVNMLQHCFIKAARAKNDNKVEIAKTLISRAFTPKNNGSWAGLAEALAYLTYGSNNSIKEYLTEDEFAIYLGLIKSFKINSLNPGSENHYAYIFVRQDISPEYQLVQAAHATCVLGSKMNSAFDPHNLYFVVIGVKDEKKLKNIQKINLASVSFVEPDIENQLTAVAFHPIKGMDRLRFKNFKRLKFKR